MVGLYRIEKDARAGFDQAAQFEFVASHFAQGGAEGLAHFGDQCQAQLIHIAEVPVEGGRHHAGQARDFAQAQAASDIAVKFLNGEKVDAVNMVNYEKVTQDNAQEILVMLK